VHRLEGKGHTNAAGRRLCKDTLIPYASLFPKLSVFRVLMAEFKTNLSKNMQNLVIFHLFFVHFRFE
jgi:hypothetical protein